MVEGDPRNTAVTTVERPDLIDMAAEWIWSAFWRRHGYPLKDIRALVAASNAAIGPPQCFVLLVDGTPVGTAGLIVSDLPSRPELTPWLAAVYVPPQMRGRGYARDLIRTVETAATRAGFDHLWLCTFDAEGLYAKAGWRSVERLQLYDLPAVLMRRDLEGANPFSN